MGFIIVVFWLDFLSVGFIFIFRCFIGGVIFIFIYVVRVIFIFIDVIFIFVFIFILFAITVYEILT